RVDLGMDRAEAVLLHVPRRRARRVNQAAHVGAVRQPGGRAVVAGGDDALVAHDHGANLCAGAGRALRDLARDRHEVLMPARTVGHLSLAIHGRSLNGSATNVMANTASVAHAAIRRSAPSGAASSIVLGWPIMKKLMLITAHASHPIHARRPSQTRNAIRS